MKPSNILLIIGLLILAVGAGLSIAKIEPWADYVLIAGALVVIARGFIRNHEKEDIPEDIWDISERIYEWMYDNS